MKRMLTLLLGAAIGLVFIGVAKSLSGAAHASSDVVVEDIPNLDPQALVVLEFVNQIPGSGFSIRWPAVAFAVGDGTLLLTAAHCVTDLEESVCLTLTDSTDIVAISPYYGGIYRVETAAIDRKADIAILRAPWSAHPALALASDEELTAATEMVIFSRPQAKQIGMEIDTERLPLLRAIGGLPNQAIQLKGTQKVARGWSGSPLVLPDSGAVAGIATRLRTQQVPVLHFWKKTRKDALGCTVNSIGALLAEHGLDAVASRSPGDLEPIPDAERCFHLTMDCFTAFHEREFENAIALAEKLGRFRDDSVQAHLLAAYAAVAHAGEPNVPRRHFLEQAESNLLAAIEVDPNNAHAHAILANFLVTRGQDSRAMAQAEAALALDPNDRLAQTDRLRLLPYDEARDEGERLLQHDRNDPYCWFYYSLALLHLNEPNEALEAAQHAVDLDPNGLFYDPMADALEMLDRLDEAEGYYKLMTEQCACQRCWYKYAQFLVEHRPDKLDTARQALDNAQAKADMGRVAPQAMEALRISLLEKTSPEQAESFLREKLDIEPNDAYTWWNLASILRTQECYEEAADAAGKAVALDPNAAYRARWADCLAKAGDLDGAQRVHDEMFERHPERARYWYWYAEFLIDYCPDRVEEALAALEKAEDTTDAVWSAPADDLAELKARLDSVAAIAP